MTKTRTALPTLLLAAVITLMAALFASTALMTPAAHADEGTQTIHVKYQWYNMKDGERVSGDFELFDAEATRAGDTYLASVLPAAYTLDDGCYWRVMKNFSGGTPAGEENVSSECTYDEATGELATPAARADEDLTIIFEFPWDHASHANHGLFKTSEILGRGVMSAQALTAQAMPEYYVGQQFAIKNVLSGANGLESSPAIVGTDTNTEGGAHVFGWDDLGDGYRFYVCFEKSNCDLFEELDIVPGRQGNGGIIRNKDTGAEYDYSGMAYHKWCVATCCEDVTNGAGQPVPIEGEGSYIKISSIDGDTMTCYFRITCNGPDGSNFQDIEGTFDLTIPYGNIAVEKSSSNPDATTDGNYYSLEGAVFGVYSDEDCTDELCELTTDVDGKAESGQLPSGTYYIKEKTAPAGFKLDETANAVAVAAGQTYTYTCTDVPYGGIHLEKSSEVPDATTGNDEYSLENAVYGLYRDSDCTDQVTELRTDADGKASYFGLEYGTYYLKEKTAPRGFEVDSTVHTVNVPEGGYVYTYPTDMPLGALEILKKSANESITNNNSCYNLEGAVYGLYRDSSCTDFVCDLTTDANGYARKDGLSAGTYYLMEKTPPEGYLPDKDDAGKPVVYSVTVPAGRVLTRELFDEPANDPENMRVGKVDDAGNKYNSTNLPQGSGTLENAEFTFTWYAGKYTEEQILAGKPAQDGVLSRTWVMKTDFEGYTAIRYGNRAKVSGDEFFYNEFGQACLPIGTVTAIETKAPEGYLLGTPKLFVSWVVFDETSQYGARIEAKNYTDEEAERVYNTPINAERVKRGNIVLEKDDSQAAGGLAQGDATLAGAVYSIINRNANPVVSPQTGESVPTGGVVCQIKTDATGFASTTRADLNGWSIPSDWNGLALAVGDYDVIEASASSGYRVNASWVGDALIEENEDVVSLDTTEDVKRGGLKVGKVDRQSKTYTPQGAGTLEGAVFEIVTTSDQNVVVDGTEYSKGQVVCTIESYRVGDKFVAETDYDTLPYGSYTVREVQTSDEGYLYDTASQAWSQSFTIRDDLTYVDFTDEADAASNQSIRGDFYFSKVHEKTMARMGGVPFKITSNTTGESHIIVTDENGMVSTKSDWNSHAYKTNANDDAVNSDGTVDDSKLDPLAGVWFNGSDVEVTADDTLGALPYDTYTVEELACKANEGLVLVTFPVRISRNARELDLGTLDDHVELKPEISTTLTDDAENKIAPANSTVALIDTVVYRDLEPGRYRMYGELHVLGADGTVGDAFATADNQFTAPATAGVVPMTFIVNTDKMAGDTVVAYEYLYDESGTLIAKHEEADDVDQQLAIPTIGTELTDGAGYHEVSGSGVVTLVDTVEYSGLVPGKTYTMNGELHEKTAAGEDAGVAKDAAGNDITAKQEFTPENASGTVEVTFTFEADTTGYELVAYERLEYGGKTYAVHANIADEDQSCTIPGIGTTAKDAATHTSVGAKDTLSIVDTVAYNALVPGNKYTLYAELHKVVSGTDAGAVKDGETVVSATKEFTPTDATGEVDVEITAGYVPAAGENLVVFEKLYRSEDVTGGFDNVKPVAEHCVATDAGQTISWPSIKTTATEQSTATHTAPVSSTVKIDDAVKYENLIAGVTYTVSGTLHYRNADGSDGGEVKDADGNAVTASTTFTATAAKGTVTITFTLDGSALAGKTVVAFEDMKVGNVTVATHADITDDAQSVTFSSDIKTTAWSLATGNHVLEIDDTALIVDTVTYENLVPGETYVMYAELHDKTSDGKDGGVHTEDGKEAVKSTPFYVNTRNGSVDVTFDAINTETFKEGVELVAFEELRTMNGTVIATHKDITDADQTVATASIGTTLIDANTKDHEGAGTTSAELVDTIAYSGLQQGAKYLAYGELYDKATGKPLTNKGVIGWTVFEPTAANGTVEVSFKIEDKVLPGATVVAFEDVYALYGDFDGTTSPESAGALIARHDDINDTAQSVTYHAPTLLDSVKTAANKVADGAKSALDKTGYWLSQYWWVILVAAFVLIGVGLLDRTTSKVSEYKDDEE